MIIVGDGIIMKYVVGSIWSELSCESGSEYMLFAFRVCESYFRVHVPHGDDASFYRFFFVSRVQCSLFRSC
jgi:hypothetical protein